MSIVDYVLSGPSRLLSNRGDRFRVHWRRSGDDGWRSTTFGLNPASNAVIVVAVSVVVAIWAGEPEERVFRLACLWVAAVSSVIGLIRLGSFSTLRIDRDGIHRRDWFAGIPCQRRSLPLESIVLDVGSLEITSTSFSYKPDPSRRAACVLRGPGRAIVLAMDVEPEEVQEYVESLLPQLAPRVGTAEHLGLKGPTAVQL